ncbi:META domain-containing protein [Flavobacterium sp. I3-2]|uniref:META domain-containing protein n=1 Tax=Flavobacterium sp. I3-2 TaxID=2748319 RepID=UPI0015AAE990|nr:META domain-containing protein [Flavobacterium sp. I3-2]
MKRIQFLFALVFINTIGFAQETIKISIKENKVPCVGVAPMECLQVKMGNSKEWTYFYDSIEGFDYEPGFTYKLKVEKTKKQGNLPADASAYNYKLKKVISKKKAKTTEITQTTNLDIFDKKLILTELNGKSISNGSIYFTINNTNKTITGKSGVNRFNSSFEFKNNELIIKPGMSTLMAGDSKSMELENEFIKTITTPFQIIQNGNVVKFVNPKNHKTEMVYNIETTNDIWSFINGKEWKLFMLENVGRDFGNASIQFNTAEQKVSGNNGCNRFFGNYKSTANEITFDQFGTTRMACQDDDSKETERKMMQYLNNATLRFDVAEQTLNFYQGDKLVMMFGLQF